MRVELFGFILPAAQELAQSLPMAPQVPMVDDNMADRLGAQLLELSYEPIFAWSVEDGITAWNRGCEQLYGYSRDEAIGRVSHDLLQTDHGMPLADVLRTLEERREWSGELRHRTRDGRSVVVESRQQLIDLQKHRVVLETNRDITERKRISERAAFMSQMSNVLAASLDTGTTIQAVMSLAVPAFADWTAVDILNDGKLERVAIGYANPEEPVLADEHTDQAGVASSLCVPLVARGRTLGALTFGMGKSRRRYSEDDLRFVEEVAHRIALAVDNAQTYKAMQLAARLKDEFLATLSHELRTPLNAILGYARLLRTGSLPYDKSGRAIEIVERNAVALTQLVEDVLDVSRIICGKIRLNIQPVDLPGVVHQAIESLIPAIDAKQLELETVLDAQASPILGDPDRLQQIVWNLVANAVKFTPNGGRVQVRLQREASHLDIVVSDTGIGIRPEFLPYVFERFRQADSTITRQAGGLGLGLAIVRHFVELHGGTVEASSGGEEQGATFVVRLPLMRVHQEAVEKADRSTS